MSHLCCTYCTIFLDKNFIDIRGRSGQYEKWKIPESVKEIDFPASVFEVDNVVLANFSSTSQKYLNKINMATRDSPFNFNYCPEKKEDDCNRASGFISDDMMKYLNYYNN